VDRVHHQLEGRIDEAPGCFGIEVFNQGGGVFDISEEDSDGLALALSSAARFHRCLLGADTLS